VLLSQLAHAAQSLVVHIFQLDKLRKSETLRVRPFKARGLHPQSLVFVLLRGERILALVQVVREHAYLRFHFDFAILETLVLKFELLELNVLRVALLHLPFGPRVEDELVCLRVLVFEVHQVV